MNSTTSIKNRIAFFLLVVFTFSVTPKMVFHHVLASHNDGQVCQEKGKTSPHFHKPVFHCSFFDLVVDSPYVTDSIQPLPERPVFFDCAVFDFSSLSVSSFLLHNESRGPPCV